MSFVRPRRNQPGHKPADREDQRGGGGTEPLTDVRSSGHSGSDESKHLWHPDCK